MLLQWSEPSKWVNTSKFKLSLLWWQGAYLQYDELNNFHFHVMFLSVLTTPSVTFVKGAEMDASQQFWVSEDLLEHLLPMLDLTTLMTIASVNPLVVSLLSRPPMWCQLLKRTCQFPYAEEYDGVAGWTQEVCSSILLKAPMIANILNMIECPCRTGPCVSTVSPASSIEVLEDRQGSRYFRYFFRPHWKILLMELKIAVAMLGRWINLEEVGRSLD